MRKLTKSLAVVSLLAPVDGYPLGIGEITLHSALNQTLNAEIALHLEADESIADFKVKLAGPEKFDEAGVPWTPSLSKIKFEPMLTSRGRAIVKLSSDESIEEPFLSFLVKITWPQGSQIKEFTVLVDPPSTYMQSVIPVSTLAETNIQSSAASNTASPYSNAATSSMNSRVQVNDTLWEIAARVNAGRNSSIEQMMIALYRENPAAFYQKNVNTLSAGAMLTVPNDAAVMRLSASQAKAEFVRQNNEWRNRRTPSSQSVSSEPSSQLTLIAPDQSGIDQQVTASSQELETSPGMTGTGIAQGDISDMAARLAALESKIAAMQATLAIKDQQLAALQAGEIETEILPSSEMTAEPSEIEPPVTEYIPEVEAKPEPETKPEAKPEVVKPESKPKPEPTPKPVSEPASDDSSYYTWLAVIMALIGGIVGWLWWRKRKTEEVTAEESMFSSAFTSSPGAEITEISQMGSTPVSDELSYQTGTIGESSILSEFTPSDFDAFETDQSEVDPISEADVYLAYGRYQQAEELMRQAIKDQPNRDECKLKLLEIFYANENAQEFENFTNELIQLGKDQEPEFWGRVVEMGSEICPAIFKGANTGTADFKAESVDETIPAAEEEPTPMIEESSDVSEMEAIDFEMPSDDSEKENGEESEDFDLDADATSESTADEVEFDFQLTADSDEVDESQGDELIDMDELETKIDLAKAYVDMGDEDAAKSIAEEVLAKGNDAQKEKAQNILDSL